MIQRIQSIYLFLAAVGAIVFIFLPFGNILYNNQRMVLDPTMNPPLWIYNAVVAAISLISIFLFRNRKLQMRIVRINAALAMIFIILFAVGLGMHIKADHFKPQIGIFMPLFVFIFLFLAYKGIKHDEDLVKSMDRLR